MKELFYTEHDKMLFWVSGYENGSNNVVEYTNSILDDAKKFASIADCDLTNVKSTVINNSRRYKNMRVFYISAEWDNLNKETLPKDCYFVPEYTEETNPNKNYTLEQMQWDMWRWLNS